MIKNVSILTEVEVLSIRTLIQAIVKVSEATNADERIIDSAKTLQEFFKGE